MLSRLLAAAGALFLFGAATASNLPPEGCIRLLREARIAGAEKQTERQRELLEKAVKEYPDQSLAYLAYLDFQRRNGVTELSEEFRGMLRARLADPEAVVPVYLLSAMVEDPKASPEELALLRDTVTARLARTPDDVRLLDILSLIQDLLGNTLAAHDAIAKVHALRPSLSTASRLSFFAQELGRWDEVLELAREERSKFGGGLDCSLVAAGALMRLGRAEEARKEIAPLLKDPKWAPIVVSSVLIPTAWGFWDAGKDREAEAAFREAARVNPKDPDAQLVLAHLFATPEERRARTAAEAERLAGLKDPGQLFGAGTARLVAGDAAGALDFLERATAADPAYEIAWFNQGVAAFKLSRWEKARDAFSRSAKLKPDRAESALFLGNSLLRLDRCTEAVAALKTALSLRPSLKEAHGSLAICYQKLGQPAKAAAEKKLAEAK